MRGGGYFRENGGKGVMVDTDKGLFSRACGVEDAGEGASVAIAGMEWLQMDPSPTSLMYEKSLLRDLSFMPLWGRGRVLCHSERCSFCPREVTVIALCSKLL